MGKENISELNKSTKSPLLCGCLNKNTVNSVDTHLNIYSNVPSQTNIIENDSCPFNVALTPA